MTSKLQTLLSKLRTYSRPQTGDAWSACVVEILEEMVSDSGQDTYVSALPKEMIDAHDELELARAELTRLREMLTWKPAGFVVKEEGTYIVDNHGIDMEVYEAGDVTSFRIAGPIVPLEPEGE